MPTFIPVYPGSGAFSISILVKDTKVWDSWLATEATFLDKYLNLYRDAVFQSHKYLIRTTPVQTTRLRAGWTSILEKYRIDYSTAILDTSLVGAKGIRPDSLAQAEGKSLSSNIDKPFEVVLINSVPYASYMEYGTSRVAASNFTNKARYRAELILTKAIEEWSGKCTSAGRLVDADPVEEAVS